MYWEKSIAVFCTLFFSSFAIVYAWNMIPVRAVPMIWSVWTSLLFVRFRQNIHPRMPDRHILLQYICPILTHVVAFLSLLFTDDSYYDMVVQNSVMTAWIAYQTIVTPRWTLDSLKRCFQYVWVPDSHDLDPLDQLVIESSSQESIPGSHPSLDTPGSYPSHPSPDPIWFHELKVNIDDNGQAFLDSRSMMNQHNVHAAVAMTSIGQPRVQIISSDHVHDSVSKSLVDRIWSMHPTVPVFSIGVSICIMAFVWTRFTPFENYIYLAGTLFIVACGIPIVYMTCMDTVVRLFQMNYAYLFMSLTLVVPMIGWLLTWKSFMLFSILTHPSVIRLVLFTILSQLLWIVTEFIVQRSHSTGIGARFMFPTQLAIAFLQYMMFGLAKWSSMFIVQVVWIQIHNMCMVSGLYYRVWQWIRRWKLAEREEQEWNIKSAWERVQHVMLWKYRVDLHLQDILCDWISRGLIWFMVGTDPSHAMRQWYNPSDTIAPIYDDHLVERWITLIVSQVIIMAAGFFLIRRWIRRDLELANIQAETHKQMLQSLGFPSSIRNVISRHFESEFPELFLESRNRRSSDRSYDDIVHKWCLQWTFTNHIGYYLCTIVCIVGLWSHPHVLFPGIV
jgi:hypothetical protein